MAAPDDRPRPQGAGDHRGGQGLAGVVGLPQGEGTGLSARIVDDAAAGSDYDHAIAHYDEAIRLESNMERPFLGISWHNQDYTVGSPCRSSPAEGHVAVRVRSSRVQQFRQGVVMAISPRRDLLGIGASSTRR